LRGGRAIALRFRYYPPVVSGETHEADKDAVTQGMPSPPSEPNRNAQEPTPPQASVATPAYEQPDNERPASASPTEHQLEREVPLGYESHVAGHDPYAALRHPSYLLYALAFALSVIGGQTLTVAVNWEIYERTKSALSLAWLGLVMAVPVLLLALPAGHVADTHSRRRIMLATHTIALLCALGLAALSHYFKTLPHAVWAIYGLMLVGNSGATFGRPARSALMPQLVPIHVFANAVTWNSSIFETASMAGPAIAGFILRRSVTHAYLFTAACWCAAMFAIFFLPEKPIPRTNNGARNMPTFSDLIAGVRFVLRSKLMLGAMTLDMFAVLLGGCTFLLPIFAQRLGVGAVGFGWLRAAPSIGALTMAMLIAHTPPFQRAGRALLVAVAGFGCATIVFGLSSNYTLSFAMLVLAGAFDNVSVVVRHTLIQLLTPDAMRGRVSAVNQVFIGSSNELGGLESGLTAAWLGPVASVVIGGVGTILVVLGVATIWPQVRRLGSLRDIRAEEVLEARGFEVVSSASGAGAK
jgi:MFS family permease